MECPLYVRLIFNIRRPKKPNSPMPVGVPDVDNLAKFYLDCANGVLWLDDRWIVELYCCKRYAAKPSTQIIWQRI